MKNKHIILLTFFGILAVLAVMVVQIFWVKAALDINTKRFDEVVTVALRKVAEKVAVKNKADFLVRNPVIKIDDYNYIVNINSEIDAEQLEHYLMTTFDYYNIRQDIDYGIYDCASNTMQYCNYIAKEDEDIEQPNLPKFEDLHYYFAVRFPNRPILSINNVPMWSITSVILGVVLLFFLYSLYVVFNQRSITKMQRDFINNMTHEFKTPISTISAIQQALHLDKSMDKNRQEKYVDIIGEEIHRLNNQVEKVLNITKLESNTLILNKEEILLHDVINQIVHNWIPMDPSDDRKIITHFKTSNDLLNAELFHLTNIISNLIENACKYSAKGKDIYIITKMEKDALCLIIKDQGIGIQKSDKEKIFDKFYRVSTGNIHNAKGFGLGLFYVKKIIEAHSWKITVRSEPMANLKETQYCTTGSEFEIQFLKQ